MPEPNDGAGPFPSARGRSGSYSGVNGGGIPGGGSSIRPALVLAPAPPPCPQLQSTPATVAGFAAAGSPDPASSPEASATRAPHLHVPTPSPPHGPNPSDSATAPAATPALRQPPPTSPLPSPLPPTWSPSPVPSPPPFPPGEAEMDALTLRFSDPRVECDYQQHQTRRFMTVDRAGLFVTGLLLLVSWLVRGGRPPCQPALALASLTFLANALGALLLQACRTAPVGGGTAADSAAAASCQPRLRTSYTAAARLGYAAAACFTAPCRREEYAACEPGGPVFGFGRAFGLDTGLVWILYQAVALPLPYREHVGVSAATMALLLALNNRDVCVAMRGTCYEAWFDHLERHRAARWLLAAGWPFSASSSSPPPPLLRRSSPRFGPPLLQACWACLLFAQLVAGFLVPAGVIYLIEDAARRRFLAGWHRRQRRQPQQQQQQRYAPALQVQGQQRAQEPQRELELQGQGRVEQQQRAPPAQQHQQLRWRRGDAI